MHTRALPVRPQEQAALETEMRRVEETVRDGGLLTLDELTFLHYRYDLGQGDFWRRGQRYEVHFLLSRSSAENSLCSLRGQPSYT